MDKKYQKEKRVFEKHKQFLYIKWESNLLFFQDESFDKKNLQEAAWPMVFCKNISKGHMKAGPTKNMVMDGLSL